MGNDFQGGNSQLRVGIEARPGQPPQTDAEWADLLFEDADHGPEFKDVPDPNLQPGAQESEGYTGKIAVGGKVKGTLFPALGYGRLFAEAQRKVTHSSPSAGVHLHRMGISETTSAKSLAARLSRDDGAPETSALVAVKGLDISVEPGKLPEVNFDLVAARVARWGLATATVGTVTATKFGSLRGLPSAALLALTDGDIYVKFVDVTAAPTSVTVKVKIGAASTYDGADVVVPCGADSAGNPQWAALTDENDVAIGTRDMPTELAIALATGIVANDIWKFTRESAAWTTTAPAMAPFNEIYCSITIDDEAYCLQSWKLSMKLPVDANECIGGRFADSLIRRGRREIRVSIDRNYVDRRIVDKLLSGARFSMQAILANGESVATGFDYLLTITCPRCKAEGKAPNAQEELKESVTFSCFPSPGDASGYVDDITFELQNGDASLVA
jgi:hypothetical protein